MCLRLKSGSRNSLYVALHVWYKSKTKVGKNKSWQKQKLAKTKVGKNKSWQKPKLELILGDYTSLGYFLRFESELLKHSVIVISMLPWVVH